MIVKAAGFAFNSPTQSPIPANGSPIAPVGSDLPGSGAPFCPQASLTPIPSGQFPYVSVAGQDGAVVTLSPPAQQTGTINVSGIITSGNGVNIPDNNSFNTPSGAAGGTSRIAWGTLGSTQAVNSLYACNALGSGYMVIWKAGVAGAASGVPGQVVQMGFATGGTFTTPTGPTVCHTVDTSGNIGAAGSVCGQSLTVGSLGSGPTITQGAGAPSATAPNGSIYFNTSGTTGSRLYVSAGGGTWNAVALV